MTRFGKFITATSLLACAGIALPASATCISSPRLTGVNLAGAEFNSSKLPGRINHDYTYPTRAELTFIAAQGANIIRLPFRWERIQHGPKQPLDADELKRLRSTIDAAKEEGLCVLLDVHNYAKYFGEEMGGKPELHDAFVDLWIRLAAAFKDTGSTAFGLMNEPAYMPLPEWATLAKRTLKEIRASGSRNLVMVGGGHWSGLHDWFSTRGGESNATAFADLHDPVRRTVLEVHQYADDDYSGTKPNCRAPDHFDPRFKRITDWALENKQTLFLGEFGMAQTPECLQTLERFLSLMEGPAWRGWAYWSAGRWWGNYPFALNTNAESPSPQWAILSKYFYSETVDTETSPPKPPAKRRQ